jgi:signal transduction histidine kinase
MRVFEILMVDDDPGILDVFGCALEYKGYRVRTAVSGEEALEVLKSKTVDVVITDLRMHGLGGLEVLKAVKAQTPKTRVIILTGNHDARLVIEALRLGVDDYIFKPCDINEVWERVADQLQKAEGEEREVPAQPTPVFNEQILNMLWIMSHDMRDSLTSMALGLEMLQTEVHGKLEKAAWQSFADIHARVARLIGMSEDFLAKATAVNGDLEMEHEEVDLREDVVDPVLDELCPEMHERMISVDNQLDAIPANHIPIKGNKVWLRTVFRNLLKNAIHHGGKGCVVTIGMQDGDTHCQLNVHNSGQPVPAQFRGKLFSKFGRITTSSEGNVAGVGLGLYVSKEILKKHGGDIWYEAKDHGSNFVFTLPHQ